LNQRHVVEQFDAVSGWLEGCGLEARELAEVLQQHRGDVELKHTHPVKKLINYEYAKLFTRSFSAAWGSWGI
jgi:hypothetical protein